MQYHARYWQNRHVTWKLLIMLANFGSNLQDYLRKKNLLGMKCISSQIIEKFNLTLP